MSEGLGSNFDSVQEYEFKQVCQLLHQYNEDR